MLARRGSVWLRLLMLAVGALGGCRGTKDDITLLFPDEASRKATSVIAVTAFEPFLSRTDSDVPDLIRCKDVGVFPPTRKVDPDTISSVPNLGNLLSEPRVSQTFPFDGWSVDIPNVKSGAKNNPWGAVLVYVEARGEVRASRDRGGAQLSATLLAGCYCVRTRDGSHTNRILDQSVKAACPALAADQGKARNVKLEPVIPTSFQLSVCGVQQLTSPRGQLLSPGPVVCVNPLRCDGAEAGGRDCFACTQPCNQLDNKENVPVMFTVDQPGGRTEPKAQVVLSNKTGKIRAQVTVDNCQAPIKMKAQVVGRPESAQTFDVTCVPPVSEFACTHESSLGERREPVGMTTLPGARGAPDFVAILFDSGMSASVEVRNPLRPGETKSLEFRGETARAIKGFSYELGTRPQERSRPVLAVATSKSVNGRDELQLYLYEWINGELVSHDRSGRPFNRDCPEWDCDVPMPVTFLKGPNCSNPTLSCGALPQPCPQPAGRDCRCPDAGMPSRPCGCRLALEFQTEVTIQAADLDGDRRADLAIATSNDAPITAYYSSQAPADQPGLYKEDGCSCGRFAQPPSAFELLRLGTPGQRLQPPLVDLVIGAPGGAFVKYASRPVQGRQLLACGQPSRFGGLVPVRDLGHGYFQCNPFIGADNCEGLEDVVLIEAKMLGSGTFDDPGSIRVVYGTDADLSLDDQIFEKTGASIELTARPLRREDPHDPRTVRVGDFNNDGYDDLAVLFGASEEIHAWLGSGNRGLGEVTKGIDLHECPVAASQDGKCSPLRYFTLADLDANGTKEVVVICDPQSNARLRRYNPVVQ